MTYLSEVLKRFDAFLSISQSVCFLEELEELTPNYHWMNRLSVGFLESIVEFGESLQVVSE